MAQSFGVAVAAFLTCFAVTLVVSLMTRPKPVEELTGLVYGMSPLPHEGYEPWYKRPTPLAIAAAVACIALNLVFM